MSIKNFFILMLLVVLGAVGLSACIATISEPTPTPPGAEAIFTAAAQTVIAQATLSAGETAIAQLTQIAQGSAIPTTAVPTPTAPAATQTVASPTLPAPTSTATNTSVPPSPTSPPFTPTPTPIPCNWAQFIGDVSIGDGAEIAPDTRFTKTWRLKNIGTCTWTPDYDLVFISGSQMSGPDVQPLNANVRPGETIDISVNLVSPSREDDYTGNWALRDGNGVIFGLGASQNQAFWVRITVEAADQVIYDFVDDFCDARWITNVTNNLVCPSPAPDLVSGYVNESTAPKLENGQTDDEPALILLPNQGSGGYIAGRYPQIEIRQGYRFRTIVGCQYNSFDCNVTFQLNYILDGAGEVRTLESWNQVYDGEFEKIDLDLSILAGHRVEFLLTVLNNGDSDEDWAQWLLPRIMR
jgi:Ig-like domain from next to BRCA1 gene